MRLDNGLDKLLCIYLLEDKKYDIFCSYYTSHHTIYAKIDFLIIKIVWLIYLSIIATSSVSER